MCYIRAYGTYGKKNVRTCVTHENMMFLFQYVVPYDNVICLNLCYPRKYDVFCPNLHYIMCNIRIHVTHEYEMCYV